MMDKSKTVVAAMEPRITRETNAMCRLHHHHNILRICEVMATRTKIYLIVDFVGDGELFSKLFQQLIFAQYFYHHNSIEHRNLRLQNLLLNIANNLKVSNFGDSTLLELAAQEWPPHYLSDTDIHHARDSLPTSQRLQRRLPRCVVVRSHPLLLLAGHLQFHDANILAFWNVKIKFI